MIRADLLHRCKRLAIGAALLGCVLLAAWLWFGVLHQDDAHPETVSAVDDEPASGASVAIERADMQLQVSITPEPISDAETKADEFVPVESTELDPPDNYVPLQVLEATKEQSRILYDAEEALVQQCMNERGFDYIPNAFDVVSEMDAATERVLPGDIEAARLQGYGLTNSLAPGASVNSDTTADVNGDIPRSSHASPNDRLLAGLSTEQQRLWDEAFMGSLGSGGSRVVVEDSRFGSIAWDGNSCLARARGQIYESDVREVENRIARSLLLQEVYATAQTDLDYQTALGQWRNCMEEHGMSYEVPGAAANHLRAAFVAGRLDKATLKAREIEIATIDATCHERQSVGESFDRALQRAESELMEDHSVQVAGLRDALLSAVNRASSQVKSTR